MTKKDDVSSGITNLINGLSGLLGSLGDLAEKGEQLEQLKKLQTQDGREMTVQSNFRVRTLQDASGEGAGGRATPRPEPISRPERVQTAAVNEVREPQVDVFEEADGVIVIAEMPGIAAGGARFELAGDVLTIEAENEQKRYRGETLLPRAFEADAMSISANAGVFEIRFAG